VWGLYLQKNSSKAGNQIGGAPFPFVIQFFEIDYLLMKTEGEYGYQVPLDFGDAPQ